MTAQLQLYIRQKLFHRLVIRLQNECFLRSKWHLRLIILSELFLVTYPDERESSGETKEPVDILLIFYTHLSCYLLDNFYSP